MTDKRDLAPQLDPVHAVRRGVLGSEWQNAQAATRGERERDTGTKSTKAEGREQEGSGARRESMLERHSTAVDMQSRFALTRAQL